MIHINLTDISLYFEDILPKGPYLPCVSMAGRALLTGYHRFLAMLFEFLLGKTIKHNPTIDLYITFQFCFFHITQYVLVFHLSYIMTGYINSLHNSLCQNIPVGSMSYLCTSVSWNINQNGTISRKLKLSNEKLFCSFWDMSFYACGWQLLWCRNDLCGQIRLIPGSAWKRWHLSYWNADFLEFISYVYNGNPSTSKKVFLYWDHSCWTSARITSLEISKGSANKFVVITVFRDFITSLGIDTFAQHFRIRTSQIARFMGPTWGPPGSCWPQMGPILAPWTLLSGLMTM